MAEFEGKKRDLTESKVEINSWWFFPLLILIFSKTINKILGSIKWFFFLFLFIFSKTINKILGIIKDLDDIYTDEDGPALLFNCQSGKEQTTVAMAVAGLIIWHKKVSRLGTLSAQ